LHLSAVTIRKTDTFSQPLSDGGTMVKVRLMTCRDWRQTAAPEGETMDSLSLGDRCAPARRGRQLVAGALCTASFVAGQLLFGQEPAPQFIFNPFAQPATAARPADERPMRALSQTVEPTEGKTEGPRETAPQDDSIPLNRLRPATITAVDSDQLPADPLAPVIGSLDAAPRIRPAKKAEPLLIQNTAYADEAVVQASRRVEARPLPLDAAVDDVAGQTNEPQLAPIVPAAEMPRRPARRQLAAETPPAKAAAAQQPTSRPQARPAWMEDIRQSLLPQRRTSQAR
jgi:hypothetical protein